MAALDPWPWHPSLPLDGYPAPAPDDTDAHLAMASELAQEILEHAAIVERERQRLKALDLEAFRARGIRNARGAEKGRRIESLRRDGRLPRELEVIQRERTEAMETKAEAGRPMHEAAWKIRQYHGPILPMCRIIAAALAVVEGGSQAG